MEVAACRPRPESSSPRRTSCDWPLPHVPITTMDVTPTGEVDVRRRAPGLGRRKSPRQSPLIGMCETSGRAFRMGRRGPAGHQESSRRPLAGSPYVGDLSFVTESNGRCPVERDRSAGETSGGDGDPLTIAGVVYGKGSARTRRRRATGCLGGGCAPFSSALMAG